MEKEFIPYEQAAVLKELGFDEPCLGLYYPNGKFRIKEQNGLNCDSDKNSYLDSLGNSEGFCTAPLYQQVFRWFREKCGFDLTIQHNKKYIAIVYSSVKNFSIDEYDTYEEAELECLKKLIEIVKNK
jgi:hypothetical protein